MVNGDAISILNELITITKDSEAGFRLAADNIQDEHVKQVLNVKAENCKRCVSDLQQCVSEMDGDPETSGTTLGAIHRSWVNIKSVITGNDPYAILGECERGEDVAKAAYAKALNNDIPDHIREIIQEKYEEVLKDHDTVRDLRDQYAA